MLEAASVAVVVTKASLLKPLREHGPWLSRELLSCSLCFGCWAGAAFYFGAPAFPRVAEAVGFVALTALVAAALRCGLYQLEKPH